MENIASALVKYISFLKTYNSKLTDSIEDKQTCYKNIKLLSNLNRCLDKVNLYCENEIPQINRKLFESMPIKYFNYTQNKIKHSINKNALELKNISDNTINDNDIFSLVCLVEFANSTKSITKDNLKIRDIDNCLKLMLDNKKIISKSNTNINNNNQNSIVVANDSLELDDI